MDLHIAHDVDDLAEAAWSEEEKEEEKHGPEPRYLGTGTIFVTVCKPRPTMNSQIPHTGHSTDGGQVGSWLFLLLFPRLQECFRGGGLL